MVKLSKETHLEMFTKMERIREFDSRIINWFVVVLFKG